MIPEKRLTECTMCSEPVRLEKEGKTNGYLIEGCLTLTAHTHGGPSETRRYCPTCTLVVKDRLMEMGFTFDWNDNDSGYKGPEPTPLANRAAEVRGSVEQVLARRRAERGL